jgi:hypothetical protein
MIVRPIVRSVRRAIWEPVNGWDVRQLFGLGEQGAWYDPSDLSTLFQDAAGTIPVTASGQPVGLMLDKRLGLVRGPELVVNGGFDTDTSGWSANFATISIDQQRLKMVATSAGDNGVRQDIPTIIGRTYAVVGVLTNNAASASARLRKADTDYTNAVTSASVAAGSSGTVSLLFTATQTVTRLLIDRVITGAQVGDVIYADNISVRELPGNHATQATAASRPIYRDVGGLRYLELDGVDDFLSTANIDFTGTDKMSVFAGLRKLTDGAQMLVDLSADPTTTSGSVALQTFNTGNAVVYRSRGSAGLVDANGGVYATPATRVLVGLSNINAPSVSLRSNGSTLATAVSSQGAGNYGNHPLYIGRRAGSSLAANMRFYGLIIRGALTSDANIAATERYLAAKTGVVLP